MTRYSLTESVLMVPGYRENTQRMLDKMKLVRRETPMSHLSDERFAELVCSAERHIADAVRIEDHAKKGDALALEAYKSRCDEARRSVRLSYDEPLARAGARQSQVTKQNASKPRGDKEITAFIESIARGEGQAKELWPAFIKRLDASFMQPRESITPKGDMQVTYVAGGATRTLTFRRFRSRLSEARCKRSKR